MKGLLTLLSALHLALAPLAASAAQGLDPVPVTSALLADVQTLIGDQGLVEGSAGHMLLHGLAGCAFNEASGADCVAGFAAGVVGSLYAGYLHQNGIDPTDPAIGQYLNTAELLGAFAGFVFSSGQGENVSLGGQVSQSGVENNYLYHEEAAEKRALEEFLANCSGGSVTCTEAEIAAAESRIAELEALDQLRDAILITACAGGPMGSNAQLCMLASQDAQAAANSYIMAGALDAFEAEFLKAAYLGNAGTFGDNPDLQIFLHGIDLGSIAGAVIATLALGGPVAARCAINPVCRAEAATAVADAIGAGYSGSITLIPAVGAVGGKLVLQAGDEILAVLDDAGRLFTPLSQEVDDAGRFLVQASDGTVGYLDEASGFVPVGTVTAANQQKIHHIFGQDKHQMDPLIDRFGTPEQAFLELDAAAQQALQNGSLNLDANGINSVARISVGGIEVDLIGGRVIDGRFIIGSASRRDIP